MINEIKFYDDSILPGTKTRTNIHYFHLLVL